MTFFHKELPKYIQKCWLKTKLKWSLILFEFQRNPNSSLFHDLHKYFWVPLVVVVAGLDSQVSVSLFLNDCVCLAVNPDSVERQRQKIGWLVEASRLNKNRKSVYLHLFLLPLTLSLWRDEQGSVWSSYLREMDEVMRERRESAEKEE